MEGVCQDLTVHTVHQAALDSAGFTNRFATDKARQGMVPLPQPSLF